MGAAVAGLRSVLGWRVVGVPMNARADIPMPLTGVFSSTQGFVVYRGPKPVYQVKNPVEAAHVAARLLMFPQQVDGEMVSDMHRRLLWAQSLIRVAIENP